MVKRTASQVGRASRRKGKAFERWCARYFTKWTGLKWETTRNSGRTDLKGDIYCVLKPDLPFVVECKDDKRYSVHAMLKPTKAFTDIIDRIYDKLVEPVEVYLIIMIKNPAGVWLHININFFRSCDKADRVMTKNSGTWIKLEHLLGGKIEGMTFDANRLEGSGREGKRQ